MIPIKGAEPPHEDAAEEEAGVPDQVHAQDHVPAQSQPQMSQPPQPDGVKISSRDRNPPI